MPSRNYYYHVHCYNTWKGNKDNLAADCSEEDWWNITWDFLKVDVRMKNIADSFFMIKNQWNSYLKEGKTAKGIYFSLKYFYEVKKNSPDKSEKFGIGIVKTIYPQACAYWGEQDAKQKGLVAQLEQEARDKYLQQHIVVRNQPVKKKKQTVDLSIVEMESWDDR